MKRKLSLVLALVLMLCGFAFAEEAQAPVKLQAADLEGVWNMEYVTSDGFMVDAKTYGLTVTLTLNADGSAEMDFNGEVEGGMKWYIEEGFAFISGYNPDGDVEMIIDKYGTLQITDAIGSMFFTRPASN